MVPEIIRWQTPLAHMRRTALVDTELRGKKIKKGDKVVMWYVSGNRDEEAIENRTASSSTARGPGSISPSASASIAGVGNRLAEMQLRIVWEEILKRFKNIEVMGAPGADLFEFRQGLCDASVRIAG